MLETSAMRYEEASESVDFSRFMSPRYYWGVVKRRWLYFLVPFILIGPPGVAIVMLLPAIYSAEGKILIESQRIPTDLVRPTVTSLAAERIQIMQQRLMTRDNLMALVEKHKLFSDRRSILSNTELVDIMRERTKIEPIELGRRAGGGIDRVTMAFTVGFEHEQPDVATRVAGELMTLILSEDLRNRTSRASETTQFLAREAGRLQAELKTIETQMVEVKRARAERAHAALNRQLASVDQTSAQIANLKTERLTKANKLSWNHPEVQALNRRIATLERTVATQPATAEATDTALEALEVQQTSLEKNLDAISQKLAAARLGEALERDQQSEKFEVIEQAAAPAQPTKPKRAKLLMTVLAAALFAGGGLAVATELLDTTIRSRADLTRMVQGHLIVAIPYIETSRDRFWRRAKVVRTLLAVGTLAGAAVAAAYIFLPPLDILWAETLVKLPRYINR